MNIELIRAILRETNVYVPADDEEPIRIEYVSYEDDDENTTFRGVGEESGDEYELDFDQIDLQNDTFYTLTMLDITQFSK